MEIEEKSRLLFMKYALPCSRTLVKRNQVTQDEVDKLIDIVKNNKEIPKNAEKIFKVAFTACSLIALDTGKNKIDEDVIREYFLKKHSDVIEKRYEEMGDFDPKACQIRLGRVVSFQGDEAIIINSSGKRSYKTDFVKVQENDKVVTHWDFVVEVIK